MLTLKGFYIPGDIGKFFKAFCYILHWNNKIKKSSYNDIVRNLENPKHQNHCSASDIEKLVKFHRIIVFILIKIMHHKNPCTVNALVLFDICNKKNIQCVLIVGAEKQEGAINGHSWIEVDGIPINEDKDTLKKYTRIIEV